MSADELRALQARLVAAADDERRTIERALHDGVQQDLIAFSVRLQLVRRLAGADLGAATAMLDELGHEVRAALDRVRILANAIYPSVLEARGLPEALRAAASGAGVAATIDTAALGRYPVEVEAAVYFVCRAALEAAAGHAGATAGVSISIREEARAIRVAVDSDALDISTDRLDQAGDRIEALGGSVALESGAAASRLVATVPLA